MRTIPSVVRRHNCRLCDGSRLELALPMTPTPIGDAYVSRERLGEIQDTYPLDLYLCLDCGHVQNVDVVDPEILFRDYIYVTSSSPGLVAHYQRYADAMVERFGLQPSSLAVEIGSNDGSLLQFFKNKGMRVLGIDPAERIAKEATAKGIPTLPHFFTEELAKSIHAEHGSAALVAANNVFAHADDLANVVRGIRALLVDSGVFVFEVSYLVDMVDRFLFDTIYHEHVSYHTIAPLKRFFARLEMQLFDIQKISSKGGSIRGFAQRAPEGKNSVTPVVSELLELEVNRGFAELAVYRKYGAAIEVRKRALAHFIDEARTSGKRIAGYGASTTVTTLAWQFDVADKLEFVVDDNPRKHGRFTPRLHVPVLPSEELYVRRPDYVIILAWNYAEPIIERHKRFLDEGGRFVIPLPELKIV